MKQHGFLQTSSAVEKQEKEGFVIQNPLENFRILFLGPENSEIKIKILGTGNMEKELWKLVYKRNEYGWRQLHFAILDYFCQKYQLGLEVVYHEYKFIEKQAPYDSLHFYESILSGDWRLMENVKKYITLSHHVS
ncbi:MAG: hypothetical protein NT098_05205 [Candidatus Parcubacteria bacterium]|nr:hypothetical protein [Candidatus Parcubacteria bacterium]